MALINCGECGKEISDKAGSCPSCGAPVIQPVEVKRSNFGCLAVILVVILAVLALSKAIDYMDSKSPPVSTKRAAPDIGLLPPIESFLTDHDEFGKAVSTDDVPNWRFGQRQRVMFDIGRDLLFYIHDGEVVTVYEDSPSKGRQKVWGEHFDPDQQQ